MDNIKSFLPEVNTYAIDIRKIAEICDSVRVITEDSPQDIALKEYIQEMDTDILDIINRFTYSKEDRLTHPYISLETLIVTASTEGDNFSDEYLDKLKDILIQERISKMNKIVEICNEVLSARLNKIKPAIPSNISYDSDLEDDTEFISKRSKYE